MSLAWVVAAHPPESGTFVDNYHNFDAIVWFESVSPFKMTCGNQCPLTTIASTGPTIFGNILQA